MKRELSYLKAVVICHGKSEMQIGQYVKGNLRLNIAVVGDKKGEKSIQINGLADWFRRTEYRSFRGFAAKFANVEQPKKGKLAEDFKIFTIMDTDDCSEQQKEAYLSKEMFREHWAHPYIFPIYNTGNLEEALEQSGVRFTKKGSERKKEYIKIFPYINDMARAREQISALSRDLKNNPNTNLNEFFEFCLQINEKREIEKL